LQRHSHIAVVGLLGERKILAISLKRAVSAERFDNDLSEHGTMSAFAIGDAGGCAAGRE
jgi:hypothetical protein